MRLVTTLVLVLVSLSAAATGIYAQEKRNPPSEQDLALAEKAFEGANALMQQRKYAEASVKYKEALVVLPDDTALLFNGGLAAYQSHDYVLATDLWKRLKKVDHWIGR